MLPFDRRWPLADAVQLACLYEATAPKAGNVHPNASFEDMHFGHFAASAIAIRGAFDLAAPEYSSRPASVGEIVLAASKMTFEQVGRNTNLGTLLLFAPIAVAEQASHVATANDLRSQICQVLNSLSADDSRCVYEAIRIAKPGGLGSREQDDVATTPPQDLVAAMRQVADMDAVARQYTNGFADVFDSLLPWFDEERGMAGGDALEAICRLQIRWLAQQPDGLIVRKVGSTVAQDVQFRAQQVLERMREHEGKLVELDEAREFDRFLRSDAHRLNPGTTADLIAATLLVSLLVS
jgi:triphosphoribosyl-dephospho-CoA synthase